MFPWSTDRSGRWHHLAPAITMKAAPSTKELIEAKRLCFNKFKKDMQNDILLVQCSMHCLKGSYLIISSAFVF